MGNQQTKSLNARKSIVVSIASKQKTDGKVGSSMPMRQEKVQN